MLIAQVKEAVAEAEASLPEIVTVIPAGVDNQRVQEAIQSFLGANIFSVRVQARVGLFWQTGVQLFVATGSSVTF